MQLPNPADAAWYAETAAGLFNAIQPEDSFKWPTIEPYQGYFQPQHAYLNTSFSRFAEVSAGAHVSDVCVCRCVSVCVCMMEGSCAVAARADRRSMAQPIAAPMHHGQA